MFPQIPDGSEIFRHHNPQVPGNLEFAMGDEPRRKIKAPGMVENRFLGDGGKNPFKIQGLLGPGDFFTFGGKKNKFTKTKPSEDKFPQIPQQLGRLLVKEINPQQPGLFLILLDRGLENHGKVVILLLKAGQKLDSRPGIKLSSQTVLYIGNNTEKILPILVVKRQGLLIGSGQEDFGTGPHPVVLVVIIHLFGDQPLGLFHHLGIEQGKIEGMKVYGIFHQKDDPHKTVLRVIGGIFRIFHIFDHGKEKFGIPVP